MYSIEVRSAEGRRRARGMGEGDARLIYAEAYQPGDTLVFSSDSEFVWLTADQAVEPALVYLPGKAFSFAIPFGDAKNGYAPQAFEGAKHAAWVRPASAEALRTRRNLAYNAMAQRQEAGCFPHASANVETRGEAQFWARNAIDGHRFNDRHGPWPYHSWGIGERRDAWLRVDFGRTVTIDEIALTLRADFPHDAWWSEATIECSDGHAQRLSLVKTAEAQYFPIGARTVQWVMLRDLVKADDPSPFPALTQIEVYGQGAE